jgi:hypothetical protein
LVYTDPDGEIIIFIGIMAGLYQGAMIASNSGMSFGGALATIVGGGMIGGFSGHIGGIMTNGGGLMSNTAGIMVNSYTNSMGMSAISGGEVDPSISFGFGSYNFRTGGFRSIFKWNDLSKGEKIGYSFGALANLNDVVTSFWPGDYQYQYEINKSDGKIGHGNIRKVVTGADGNVSTEVKISVANSVPISTKNGGILGALEYAWKSNFNKHSGGPEYWLTVPETGWERIPLKLNYKIVDWMASSLNDDKGLWGISRTRFGINFGCVSYSARALWTAGVPTIPIINYLGPKVLWFQLAVRQAGIYSSPYLYGF